VDQVICDAPTRRAVIEWTHFKRKPDVVLRGDDWYVFSQRASARFVAVISSQRSR
jgi:hypothetical protein